ncbi:host attachment protein [Sulfitobacter mediterraneus]|jgi:protein required for attachment to host cells|uniref:host attachment family protein n=1 Tax=Sulfitobacter TaxID=60136 RepID=UPI00193259E5|nr:MULTISPECIES: host attachment family protein [Sulfitobacter]MBM1631564.1 host attachment protein [Sulfitobacter mediterraneus]MBM1639379.1 host attachment protein [Sulfitobacter mediterraneus]MBM1643428.1 host attachment protein [Sulfitobacter mediterraneus]MBM1647474.1 host attachment protein [Sulfitobacter mediterraneus]MBM1651519.1 host attachment protein [Sulfitobacter mediterraneus]
MTQIDNGTWVLIADGEKALFLENKTDGQDPFLEVFREEEQDNPPNREQAANRPGRFNDGPSVHRSAVDDTDWHELAKDRFAHDLADILYKQAHKGRFDKLVIVAPPNTLGELRQELHQEVTQKVIGEVPKTLTNHPIDEIEKIVSTELAAA